MTVGSATWSGRRVLVTGATGMVGSCLTRWLVEADAYVVALVPDWDPQSELIRSGTIGAKARRTRSTAAAPHGS